jgi:hypothetical protein
MNLCGMTVAIDIANPDLALVPGRSLNRDYLRQRGRRLIRVVRCPCDFDSSTEAPIAALMAPIRE